MPNIGLTAVAFIPYVFSLVVAWSYLVRFGRVADLGQKTVDTSLLFTSSVGGAATASSSGTKSGMCEWRQPTFDDFWHIMVV